MAEAYLRDFFGIVLGHSNYTMSFEEIEIKRNEQREGRGRHYFVKIFNVICYNIVRGGGENPPIPIVGIVNRNSHTREFFGMY